MPVARAKWPRSSESAVTLSPTIEMMAPLTGCPSVLFIIELTSPFCAVAVVAIMRQDATNI